jgi:hypothetical protein
MIAHNYKWIFVEQSSTEESYHHTPPQIGNDCKEASLFLKSNYFSLLSKKKQAIILLSALTYIGIYHMATTLVRSKQASLVYKTTKYFHVKKNDTDYHM